MVRIKYFCAILSTAISMCFCSCPTSQNNSDASSCKKVNTIDRPLSKIFLEQPVYYFMLSKNERFTRVDNACITFFPMPDSPETFKTYLSWTYTDNSYLIETFISKSYATGANQWAYPTRGFVNYNLGYFGCGSFLRYSCPNYGNAAAPFFIGFGPGLGPVGNGTGKLTPECVRAAQRLAEDNGLDLGDFVLMPCNLPPRCVFRQICLPKDNPLYGQQNNSCKAN